MFHHPKFTILIFYLLNQENTNVF